MHTVDRMEEKIVTTNASLKKAKQTAEQWRDRPIEANRKIVYRHPDMQWMSGSTEYEKITYPLLQGPISYCACLSISDGPWTGSRQGHGPGPLLFVCSQMRSEHLSELAQYE